MYHICIMCSFFNCLHRNNLLFVGCLEVEAQDCYGTFERVRITPYIKVIIRHE